jgi:hypothetical protein
VNLAPETLRRLRGRFCDASWGPPIVEHAIDPVVIHRRSLRTPPPPHAAPPSARMRRSRTRSSGARADPGLPLRRPHRHDRARRRSRARGWRRAVRLASGRRHLSGRASAVALARRTRTQSGVRRSSPTSKGSSELSSTCLGHNDAHEYRPRTDRWASGWAKAPATAAKTRTSWRSSSAAGCWTLRSTSRNRPERGIAPPGYFFLPDGFLFGDEPAPLLLNGSFVRYTALPEDRRFLTVPDRRLTRHQGADDPAPRAPVNPRESSA